MCETTYITFYEHMSARHRCNSRMPSIGLWFRPPHHDDARRLRGLRRGLQYDASPQPSSSTGEVCSHTPNDDDLLEGWSLPSSCSPYPQLLLSHKKWAKHRTTWSTLALALLRHRKPLNCFIESYGLKFVASDLNRDTALQEVTDDDDRPGGRRGLLTQTIQSVEEP